ncbi:MAG TPA: hypothetical protein VFH51_07985 [Myxococcota bacterium]|nr:hypothetical protein [Myxococcota bacterium]
MQHRSIAIVAVLALFWGAGCAVTRSIRPVGEGNLAAGVSVGGPIFQNLGAPIPVPLTSAYARLGLDPQTDVDVGLHLPVVRAAGIDAGVARLLWLSEGLWPAFMLGARIGVFGNVQGLLGRHAPETGSPYGLSPRVFEEIYGTFSWQPNPALLTWTGLHLFGQLERARVRPTLLAGAEWRPVDPLGFSLEAKWMTPLSDQRNLAIDYRGIAGRGALAVQVGAAYYFGQVL